MSKATIGPWTMRQSGGVYVIDGHEGKLQNIAEVYTGIEDALVVMASRDLLEALKIAVLQNSCDMVMTGEELRQCEMVIAKATGDKS